jgi:coproporphyrinogen III oxidase-like Fe-S oxidoreductase
MRFSEHIKEEKIRDIAVIDKLRKKQKITKNEFGQLKSMYNDFIKIGKLMKRLNYWGVLSKEDSVILDKSKALLNLKGMIPISIAKDFIEDEDYEI